MIAASFQNEIATFIESQIAKVQINGTYDITDFTVKSVVNNKVNIAYMIPFAAVAEVHTMALIKANGDVIAHHEVYVPISSDTNITHTFTIMEVS